MKQQLNINIMSLVVLMLTSACVAQSQFTNAVGTLNQSTNSQDAFTQSIANLQANPTDTALREKIIKLALTMDPKPALPNEAERLSYRAQADFSDNITNAINDYQKALLIAPWFAPYYFNLGLAQQRAGQPLQSSHSFQLYLLAAPDAIDAEKVRKFIIADPSEALAQYVQALQKTPNYSDLREKIIKLVLEMNPPPAIPEDARQHYIKACTLLNDAKQPSDSSDAAEEFRQALLVAPWWGEAYMKMGQALELAQRYDEAIASLKLFMATRPQDQVLRQAQDEIYKIEAKRDEAAKETRAKAEAERKEQDLYGWMLGRWQGEAHMFIAGRRINISFNEVDFKKFGNIIQTDVSGISNGNVYNGDPRATVSDTGISWEVNQGTQFGGAGWIPVSVTVSYDKRTISYTYPCPQSMGGTITEYVTLTKE